MPSLWGLAGVAHPLGAETRSQRRQAIEGVRSGAGHDVSHALPETLGGRRFPPMRQYREKFVIVGVNLGGAIAGHNLSKTECRHQDTQFLSHCGVQITPPFNLFVRIP